MRNKKEGFIPSVLVQHREAIVLTLHFAELRIDSHSIASVPIYWRYT